MGNTNFVTLCSILRGSVQCPFHFSGPIQASQESPHQSPEPRGHPIIVLSPLQVPHKSQDPPVPDNPVNVQHKENVTDNPPVAGEQPQQIQASVQNKYQVVPEGEGE